MKVGFLLFEKWHGKTGIGSSRIRGHWICKYWDEAEPFIQGEYYDAVVFQKVYWYDYLKAFGGIKILDICDPDYLNGWLDHNGRGLVEMSQYVDAITTSTEALAEDIRQMYNGIVKVIPDRVDLEEYNKIKIHRGRAKSVVWFGYAHNTEPLDLAMPVLNRLGLKLTVISDMRPPYPDAHQNKKFKQETIVDEILKHDIVLFPDYKQGRYYYKSNNKTIQAWALGMPVATMPQDLSRFLDPGERNKEGKKRRKEVEEKYDVRLSVKDFKELINKIKKEKYGNNKCKN